MVTKSSPLIPQLKVISSDFMVSEMLFLDVNSNEFGRYGYYKVTKTGLTTFEAIELIANYFNINRNLIAYAGLKDEDGITEQYISVDGNLSMKGLPNFNKDNSINENKFIRLIAMGFGNKPIQPGELLGNQFKIIIRNLELPLIENIFKFKKQSYNFLNYYGSQRFGLPNSLKNTHIIGSHLIKEDYYSALLSLSSQPSTAGEGAKKILSNGDLHSSEDFFKNLNPKLTAFYQSSYYSHIWNENLKELIIEHNIPYKVYEESGIIYFFNNEILGNIPKFLPYIRVIFNKNNYEKQYLLRQVNIQLNIVCHRIFEDRYHPKKQACEVSFFLPSGVYATVAIYQFINHFQFNNASYIKEAVDS